MELYFCILSTDGLPRDRQALEALALTLPFGEEERNRLLRIHHEQTLRQSLCGKLALLRLLEARGLGETPVIRRAEHGKPYFEDPALPPFSLSHSDSLSLAVLGSLGDAPIGADLQFVDPRRDTERLALHFLLPEEREALAATDDPEIGFFRLWSQKEAVAKQSGEGLNAVLNRDLRDCGLYLQTLLLRHGGKTAFVSFAAPEEITMLHPIHPIKEITYE